jgi:hypothetical protein
VSVDTPMLNPADLRAFVAIQTLGICAALEAGAIDGAQAARWLFQREMHDRLAHAGACQGCLGLVDLGAAVTAGGEAAAEAVAKLRAGALAMLGADPDDSDSPGGCPTG